MFVFAADLENNMERNLLIELLEDGEKVSLYSPRRNRYEDKQNYG